MADVLDPRHWQERAAKTRDKAEQFGMRISRDRLLKIAEEYDRMPSERRSGSRTLRNRYCASSRPVRIGSPSEHVTARFTADGSHRSRPLNVLAEAR
jgi:hypothetical protein